MSQPITHTLHGTPNPSLVALRVQIRQDALVSDPTLLPAEGELYKDFPGRILTKDWMARFSEYVYVNCDDGKPPGPNPDGRPPGVQGAEGIDGSATLSLLFLPNLTQEQKDTAFRTTTSFGNHRWPPILQALAFFKDHTLPRASFGTRYGQGAYISGPTYYVREIYQCEVNEGSRFILEEFFSDTPFDIPLYPVPVPRAVYFDIPGVRGSFPECIGPEIKIPRTQTASSASYITGNAALASGAISGQRYPATDMEEWEPYVLTDQQDFQNGYIRKRIRVIPPIGNDELIVQ